MQAIIEVCNTYCVDLRELKTGDGTPVPVDYVTTTDISDDMPIQTENWLGVSQKNFPLSIVREVNKNAIRLFIEKEIDSYEIEKYGKYHEGTIKVLHIEENA